MKGRGDRAASRPCSYGPSTLLYPPAIRAAQILQCRLTDITSCRADITCCHNLENFECVASLRRGDEPTRANRKERAPSLIRHEVGLGSLRTAHTPR